MIFLVQQQPAAVYNASNAFDANLPTWVFIHGAANDHRVWLPVLEGVSTTSANYLALDLPGHGKTFAEAKPSIEAYADWVINLLDNGAINRATLVGHSMGSLIALDCARRYAARVDKLVLIGAAAPMPVADKILEMARDATESAYDMVTRASFWVEKNADGTWPAPSTEMQTHRQRLSENRQGVLANDMQACNQYTIDNQSLSSINTPTKIVIGEQDKMTPPAAGHALAAALPNAHTVKIANAGHMMPIEASANVRDALTFNE